MSSRGAAEGMRRHRSRTRDLAERRRTLVKLLIALFVARIVVTITEIAESGVTWWSLLVTAAIGIEAWRAWNVSRAARAHPDAPPPPPLPDTAWDRMLRPLERFGPASLYAFAVLYALAYLALLAAGASRDTLVDVAVAAREVITLFFLFVLIAGYRSVRAAR
ncbi:MAG TPA: hypothetical protein VFR97_13325 [Capillimicrobium sp.]|nr:hypothetical protein [Capillimicrobium sp.]